MTLAVALLNGRNFEGSVRQWPSTEVRLVRFHFSLSGMSRPVVLTMSFVESDPKAKCHHVRYRAAVELKADSDRTSQIRRE